MSQKSKKQCDKSLEFLKNISRRELGELLVMLYTEEKKKGRDLFKASLSELADFYREKIIYPYVIYMDWFNLELLREKNRRILEHAGNRETIGTLTNIFDDILTDLCREAKEKTINAYRQAGQKAFSK